MYLNAARLASALHARGYVDGVAPNVVVRLAGPDDPCRDGSMIDTYEQSSSISVIRIAYIIEYGVSIRTYNPF